MSGSIVTNDNVYQSNLAVTNENVTNLMVTKILLPGAIAVRNYAEKLANGTPIEIFSSKPVVGGQTIECNHPAFIFGHLSLYPSRIFKLLEVEQPGIIPPKSYYDQFMIGAECLNDPERKIYPAKDELVNFFIKSTDLVIKELPNIPEEKFYAINVEERSKDRFPIVGSFISYLLISHANGHLGQISTWRRCMGLPPV